jgi:glucose-6-phosphate 1-dehydrogenase
MTTATVVHPEVGTHSHESPFVSRVNPPEAFTLVFFGATGDLAGRKLLPALASLLQNEYLPAEFVIVGVDRSGVSRRRSEEPRGVW